jgi:hypothetical protein
VPGFFIQHNVLQFICVAENYRISFSLSFFFFFGGIEVSAQGLTLARQALYHLSHSTSPFLALGISKKGFSILFQSSSCLSLCQHHAVLLL